MRHPFLRTLAGVTAAAPTDPNFKNVTLLLHGDGTNGGQNNTFVDGSTNNFAITRSGNTTQGTFSPYGDRWSNYFDGTGDYLTVPANAAHNFGTGDFTMECWFYRQAAKGQLYHDSIFGNRATVFPGAVWHVFCGPASGDPFYFQLSVGGTGWIISGGTCRNGEWNHIAVARSGNTFTLYINGSSVATGTQTAAVGDSTNVISVGAFRDGAYPCIGYVSNLRIVKGTAVYTSNFTPSTTPLTAVTNTSLLTCQSNRFRDASTNNFTITRNGDVSVQRFSPFSQTAAYAAGTIGGSGYFDGTGDNLSISSASGLCNFATNEAYTFQVWAYRLSTAEMVFIGSASSFQVGVINAGVRFGRQYIGDIFFNVGSVPVGAWSHITICRNTSGTTRCWTNGVSAASTTDTGSFALGTTNIGSQPGGTAPTNGYLCDMRILKGQALYDPTSSANIEVPTAPLSAVTNTSFLLNFTNAAILDNAMMAVPETVGDVKINTSVKKYGTGSLSFDGNSDYLWIKNAGNLFDLSAGDFTVELWFYAMDKGDSESAESLIQQNEHTWRIWLRKLNGPRVLGYTVNSTNAFFTAGNLFNWDTWNHVAICKSGTTTTMYLNGVSVGTTTLVPAASSGPVYIGSNLVGTTVYWPMLGYIDDLRITKGVARYTAAFTPPTAALPDL